MKNAFLALLSLLFLLSACNHADRSNKDPSIEIISLLHLISDALPLPEDSLEYFIPAVLSTADSATFHAPNGFHQLKSKYVNVSFIVDDRRIITEAIFSSATSSDLPITATDLSNELPIIWTEKKSSIPVKQSIPNFEAVYKDNQGRIKSIRLISRPNYVGKEALKNISSISISAK